MSAFWDASALLHVCVPGQTSSHAKSLLRGAAPVVWWATSVEVESALARLYREAELSCAAYTASRHRLTALLSSCKEIQPTEAVRALAVRQLGQFPLRAADALQLAAALIWCKQKPKGRLFVCNDLRLDAAADSSGLDVVET